MKLCVDTVRFLSAQAVQKANSGHPGMPMAMAPTAFALWSQEMKHSPKNPNWPNRDRFVLSNGHGSALLYSLLHLFGYGLSIEDLKQFRQLGSLTPGHPEYGHTAGVEVTTGPLGQGIANSVGFAWAENYLAHKFNRPGYDVVDHYTYCVCGDGCLMEGIASEAASLAGTLGLSKLIVLYDSNNITIEGNTDVAFTENVAKRFEAFNWQVLYVEDGNNTDAIIEAIQKAKQDKEHPTLIEIKTQIGFGSPNKQGKASAHGEPLGVEELKLAQENLGFNYEAFTVPKEVEDYLKPVCERLSAEEKEWDRLFNEYEKNYPELYNEWQVWHSNELPVDLINDESFWRYEGDIATRSSSEIVLNKLSKIIPNLIGGSADLSPSTKTIMKDRGDYTKADPTGSNLHFGIREHAMAAIANAFALHGGLRPYIAGFFVFSDYMKPSFRLAAMMKLPVINILTHDSIGVGEDGPTHQPIEQLAAMRSIPGFTVTRPCDSNETAAAWYLALTRKSPTALVLTRQNVPLLKETGKGAIKGAYILSDNKNPQTGKPDVILMASGSEVHLIYNAAEALLSEGIHARVVSIMSFEVFEEQTKEYKESVLPSDIRERVAVEAASSFGWHRYTGIDGAIIAMEDFGTSAPANELFKKFGFTVENVVKTAKMVLR